MLVIMILLLLLMQKLLLRVRCLGLGAADYLFFNESPTQTQDCRKHLSTQSFDKELRRVCDWNNLQGISSHSFRRTQLTELYRDGWSLREIQHISGHRSLQSLQEEMQAEAQYAGVLTGVEHSAVTTWGASAAPFSARAPKVRDRVCYSAPVVFESR